MFRFRPTSVSGFPRAWLSIRIPCTTARSPLVTPDGRISRIRRSQIRLTKGIRKELTYQLQHLQAQSGQSTILTGSFQGTEGTLTPPMIEPVVQGVRPELRLLLGLLAELLPQKSKFHRSVPMFCGGFSTFFSLSSLGVLGVLAVYLFGS
jgi:hypothetical protein